MMTLETPTLSQIQSEKSLPAGIAGPRPSPIPFRAPEPSIPDWAAFTCEFLVMRVLPEQHACMKEELSCLQDLTGCAAGSRVRQAEPHAFELLLARFKQVLDAHVAEEKLVFPFLLQLELAYIGRNPASSYPIRVGESLNRISEQRHAQRQELEWIRSQAAAFVGAANGSSRHREAYNRLERLYRMLINHLHIEENVLFRRAARLEAEMFG